MAGNEQRKGFLYNSYNSATNEFSRLCDRESSRKPRLSAQEVTDAREAFKAALVYQFGACFGTEVHDLSAWQRLCEAIGFDEIPGTVPECREMVEGVHVNVIDLIDKTKLSKYKTHFTVQRFASVEELAVYSRNTGKLFPHYDGGRILSFLLRDPLSALPPCKAPSRSFHS
ncbi:hypothetical protein PENSPDRAFT_739059 [Peniophora sp. CONT]|nr:hypothetical protein PENSPDRAFT_739059 [Peniophora sp. CONT]